MVEKPKREDAPSNLYISGRYILQPEIFDVLDDQEPGAGGEIQVTDAMKRLAETQRFTGFRYHGRTFDTGTKAGFLMANIAFGLAHPELGPELPWRADAPPRRRGSLSRRHDRNLFVVIPGLDPGTHSGALAQVSAEAEWIAGSEPGNDDRVLGFGPFGRQPYRCTLSRTLTVCAS